jgi:cardiolipin synthase
MMIPETWRGGIVIALHLIIQGALMIRVLLRRHRQPTSRIAWIVVILSVPLVGMLAYLLFGETNIGRRRVERMRSVIAKLPRLSTVPGLESAVSQAHVPDRYAHLFQVGKSINQFDPVGGNQAYLLPDSNATIASIVKDIDTATDTVHLIFYIWLADHNGCKVIEALKGAAARGVTCRIMADGLGSGAMIKSTYWKAMREAGIHLAVALPIGNPLLRPLKGRIDLRNHRKVVVIDNRITYCGSQNCADPEFRVKAKYAPWVDVMMRFEGPIVRQNQYLFASDWESESGENINALLQHPIAPLEAGFPAQVVGTGPTVRNSAMPELFETLMYAARNKLLISTPYYVPDDPMQAGLCASARRGVDTTIIFPARNDSWIVGAASRSYYAELLEAGVKIFEYEGGLLHAKTLTLDGDLTLIGSANMDRRSFELNYENNILLYDPDLTTTLIQRQNSYIAHSRPVTLEQVESWSWKHRLFNNAVAMLGPVL